MAKNELDATKRKSRLSTDRPETPWVKAQEMKEHCLFWLGVSSFPLRRDEKLWVLEFLTRFDTALKERHSLRGEIFYQWKQLAQDGHNTFNKYAASFMAMMGLCRKPGEGIPAFPSNEYLRGLLKSGEEFKIGEWTADYCYWFVLKKSAKQRELFLGTGGMVTVYLPPDPKTRPPKLPMTPKLRAVLTKDTDQISLEEMVEGAFSMGDSFMAKSKKVFGVGLEEEAQYRGISFIVPLLGSSHFFAATAEERARWFEVFPVYLNESVADKGMILAFEERYEPTFLDVLDSMYDDDILYPGQEPQR